MKKAVEGFGTGPMYHVGCPKNRTDDGPIRVECRGQIDYRDMTDYIRAWPDKLVSFVADRLCDDDMAAFTRALYEYICEADRDGPNFEEWRTS